MAKVSAAERQEAIETLREMLRPGDTLHTVLRHVSASGMSRIIDVYLLTCEDGRPGRRWLSRLAAKAAQFPYDERREAVRVGGAGMDMGFHLVYTLAWTLFGNTEWPCTGEKCPSETHSNGEPYPHDFERDPAKLGYRWMSSEVRDDADLCTEYKCGRPSAEHPTRPVHGGGGYALRQEWL